jgi:hypothetical protein
MGLQFELGVDYSSLSFSKDLGEFGKLEVNYSTVSLAPFLGFTGGALGGAGFAYFAGLELFYPVSQSATLSILGQKETKDKPFDSFLLYGIRGGAGYRISDLLAIFGQFHYHLGSATAKSETEETNGTETTTKEEKTKVDLGSLTAGVGMQLNF